MDAVLLPTKVRIPPQPPDLVQRSRLIDVLRRGIPQHKVTLLSAPAGYGKTTLLAQWARASPLPVAWLSLDEEDNDVERFFRYLLAAWETVQPDVLESPLGILLGAKMPDRDAVLSAFVNQADQIAEHTVFVLDDYHLIADEAIHQALTFLLDHLPATCHVALAGRSEPPLPVARYRARRRLLELRAQDLSFRPEETRRFLQKRMERADLDPDEIEALQQQLEGWIAGLQLVTVAGPGRRERAGQRSIGGRHRFIADYLRQDVLAHLPEETRRFLLQTSVARRLCAPLCNALTGTDNGQEMLETVERANLFLMPLDNSREWFRYHRLFADFLYEELKRRHPDDVPTLHRRAFRWHLDRDLPEPAFRHALEAGYLEGVVHVFDRYFNAKLFGGEFALAKRWLDQLPAEWIEAYPSLGLGRAGYLAYTGSFEECVRCIDEVEERLLSAEGDDVPLQLARVNTVRCLIACAQNLLSRAETFAERALADLPEEDVGYRPAIYATLGDTYRQNGRWQEAQECYHRALEFIQAPAIRVQSAHVFGALADLELRQGQLRAAAEYWRQALAAIQEREQWGRLSLPVTGWVYLRMGELLYEWNELAAAGEHFSRGLERAELGGDVRAIIAGCLLGGRLALTEGDVEAAAGYLERARALVEDAHFPHWKSRFERCQLELWLAQDSLRAAVNWADEMLEKETLEERPESEVAQLALARVLIVKGDGSSLERALAFLESLLKAAEEEGRAGVLVEALALQALANWRKGAMGSAMRSLERALRRAEPEGYVRRFADLGLPMARLLQEAHSRDVLSGYVESLLAAFDDDLAFPAGGEGDLPEPLTGREKEVLAWLAAGLTNREIAEELVISPKTVKTHASNIYGKLGVGGRTEAAARARELNLLD